MKLLKVEQYEGIKAALQVGSQTVKQIAEQFDVSESGVRKVHLAVDKGFFDDLLDKAKRFHEHTPQKKSKSKAAKGIRQTESKGEADKLEARVLDMREKGLSYKEIAKKVGITPATVGYYAVARGARRKQQLSPGGLDSPGKEQTNGNNPANRNILIGIAYAETERFISNLSERIAIPPEILRRRLAELLGHSPLR